MKLRYVSIFVLLFVLTLMSGIFLQKTGIVKQYANFVNEMTSSWVVQFNKKEYEEEPQNFVYSNNYDFQIDTIFVKSYAGYGGIDFIDENLVFVDGEGILFSLEGNELKKVKDLNLPLYKDEFEAEFGEWRTFGVKDILISSFNELPSIFLSAITFVPKKKCYRLSVFQILMSKIEKNFEHDTFGKAVELFSTSPCLGKHATNDFAGTSSGGRLVRKGDNLLLSTGDFFFDGVNEKNLMDEYASEYGKVLAFNLKTSKKEVISKGSRNPQGMTNTPWGIFISEHGPQGGDELNLISINGKSIPDFGWPSASYGVDYGENYWPFDPSNRNHNEEEKFTNPEHFWVPSIGISNIGYIGLTSKLAAWRNSILVTSLRAGNIFRVKLDNFGQKIGIEEIEVGFRIRDLIVKESEIYLLEDTDPALIHRIYLPNKKID